MEKGPIPRTREQVAKEAIALALQGRWEEAVVVNRQILETFPQDVEAWNRLGRALMEIGRYEEAAQAYHRVLELSPSNTIARKNLERLQHLQRVRLRVAPSPASSTVFLEETGKATTAVVHSPAPREVLLQLDPGDPLDLAVEGNLVAVSTGQGVLLGYLPPRLGNRIRALMEKGDRFTAAVASVDDQRVRVLLRVVANPSGETPFPLSDYPLPHPVEEGEVGDVPLALSEEEGEEAGGETAEGEEGEPEGEEV
jgi:hypothetical protein